MIRYRSILLAGLTLLVAACTPDASINNEVNSESVAGEAAAASPDANPDELAGQWVGGFSFSSDEVITEPHMSLTFEVDEDSNLLKGEVSILLRLDKRKISIEGLELTDALVSFNVNEIEFMGTLEGIKLTGEVRRGTEVGEFSMIRTETTDDAQPSAVIGSYVFDSGAAVDIVRGPGWLGYKSELLIFSHQNGLFDCFQLTQTRSWLAPDREQPIHFRQRLHWATTVNT